MSDEAPPIPVYLALIMLIGFFVATRLFASPTRLPSFLLFLYDGNFPLPHRWRSYLTPSRHFYSRLSLAVGPLYILIFFKVLGARLVARIHPGSPRSHLVLSPTMDVSLSFRGLRAIAFCFSPYSFALVPVHVDPPAYPAAHVFFYSIAVKKFRRLS